MHALKQDTQEVVQGHDEGVGPLARRSRWQRWGWCLEMAGRAGQTNPSTQPGSGAQRPALQRTPEPCHFCLSAKTWRSGKERRETEGQR